MKLTTTAEFLQARKQQTKNKGEAVIIEFMTESGAFKAWAFDEAAQKKALAKKKGQDIKLTWEGREFKGFLQVGGLVGVE